MRYAQPLSGEYVEEVLLMYAIIATGGKQYRVSQGDVIFVEKIEQDVDSTIDLMCSCWRVTTA